MPSSFAATAARCGSREAIPAISLHAPFCIPGMTFRVAMDATPSTPHLTFFAITMHSTRNVDYSNHQPVARRSNTSGFYPMAPYSFYPMAFQGNRVKHDLGWYLKNSEERLNLAQSVSHRLGGNSPVGRGGRCAHSHIWHDARAHRAPFAL